jgi:hypothetical protein
MNNYFELITHERNWWKTAAMKCAAQLGSGAIIIGR